MIETVQDIDDNYGLQVYTIVNT